MQDQTVTAELTAEANYTPTTVYIDLARLSLKSRLELMEAARVLNPGNILDTIVTQHSTVASNALTRHLANITHRTS
jgi:hypothetical protein